MGLAKINRPIATLFLDIRKAYDSVPVVTLTSSMNRQKIPPPYISLLMEIAANRSVQGITRYGLTDPSPEHLGSKNES